MKQNDINNTENIQNVLNKNNPTFVSEQIAKENTKTVNNSSCSPKDGYLPPKGSPLGALEVTNAKMNILKENRLKLEEKIKNTDFQIFKIRQNLKSDSIVKEIKIKPIKLISRKDNSRLYNEEREDKLVNEARNFVMKLRANKNIRLEKQKAQREKNIQNYIEKNKDALNEIHKAYINIKERENSQSASKKKNYPRNYSFSPKVLKEKNKAIEQSLRENSCIEECSKREIKDNSIWYNRKSLDYSNYEIFDANVVKRSPYYFNEPKYIKVIEMKEKYGNKIQKDNSEENTLILNAL